MTANLGSGRGPPKKGETVSVRPSKSPPMMAYVLDVGAGRLTSTNVGRSRPALKRYDAERTGTGSELVLDDHIASMNVWTLHLWIENHEVWRERRGGRLRQRMREHGRCR